MAAVPAAVPAAAASRRPGCGIAGGRGAGEAAARAGRGASWRARHDGSRAWRVRPGRPRRRCGAWRSECKGNRRTKRTRVVGAARAARAVKVCPRRGMRLRLGTVPARGGGASRRAGKTTQRGGAGGRGPWPGHGRSRPAVGGRRQCRSLGRLESSMPVAAPLPAASLTAGPRRPSGSSLPGKPENLGYGKSGTRSHDQWPEAMPVPWPTGKAGHGAGGGWPETKRPVENRGRRYVTP